MFVLTSEIKIGQFIFRSISEVEIIKSIEELSDTATIKMPSKFIVRQNGEEKLVENALKVGDKVSIKLGYEEKYEGVEFTGFVVAIGSKIPLEIKCEDAMWLLRRKNITHAFNDKTPLKTILQKVVENTEIELSDKIPNVEVEKFIIRNANGTQVLQKLKEHLALSIYLDSEGKLYAGLEQLNNLHKEAIYDLNYNLVENNLEYKTAEQKRLRIKYTYMDSKNKKKSVEVGDKDGELRTFHTSIISDKKKDGRNGSCRNAKTKIRWF